MNVCYDRDARETLRRYERPRNLVRTASLADGRGKGRAMRCQVCGKDAGPDGGVCGYCGATVRSLLGNGIPFGVPDAELRKREEERRRRAERLRRRRRGHALAGAVIFFALNLIFWIIRAIQAVGIVALSGLARRAPAGGGGSVWGMLLGLLVAVVTAVVVGAPAGYVISRRNAGPWGGAFLGAGVFAAGFTFLNLWRIITAASPGVAFLYHVIAGGVVGSVTGALIGFHVEGDSA